MLHFWRISSTQYNHEKGPYFGFPGSVQVTNARKHLDHYCTRAITHKFMYLTLLLGFYYLTLMIAHRSLAFMTTFRAPHVNTDASLP